MPISKALPLVFLQTQREGSSSKVILSTSMLYLAPIIYAAVLHAVQICLWLIYYSLQYY